MRSPASALPEELDRARRRRPPGRTRGARRRRFALQLGRPLLLEGRRGGQDAGGQGPGRWSGAELIRLQCYEGTRRLARRSTSGTTPASCCTCEPPRRSDTGADAGTSRASSTTAASWWPGPPPGDRPRRAPAGPARRRDRAGRRRVRGASCSRCSPTSLHLHAGAGHLPRRVAAGVVVIPPTRPATCARRARKRRCLYHWLDHPPYEREVRSQPPAHFRGDRRVGAGQVAAATPTARDGPAQALAASRRPDQRPRLLALGARRWLDVDVRSCTLGAVPKYREDTDRVTTPRPAQLCSADDQLMTGPDRDIVVTITGFAAPAAATVATPAGSRRCRGRRTPSTSSSAARMPTGAGRLTLCTGSTTSLSMTLRVAAYFTGEIPATPVSVAKACAGSSASIWRTVPRATPPKAAVNPTSCASTSSSSGTPRHRRSHRGRRGRDPPPAGPAQHGAGPALLAQQVPHHGEVDPAARRAGDAAASGGESAELPRRTWGLPTADRPAARRPARWSLAEACPISSTPACKRLQVEAFTIGTRPSR